MDTLAQFDLTNGLTLPPLLRAPNGCLCYICLYDLDVHGLFCRCHLQNLPAHIKRDLQSMAKVGRERWLNRLDWAVRRLVQSDQPLLIYIKGPNWESDFSGGYLGLEGERD